MRKNRITSCLQVGCILYISPLSLINLIVYFIVVAADGIEEFRILFGGGCLGCILIIGLSVSANLFFSYFGKKRILIEEGRIIYGSKEYPITEGSRLQYSRINEVTALSLGCPGELALIINNEQLKLGWYFRFEVNKMRKFIPVRESPMCVGENKRV